MNILIAKTIVQNFIDEHDIPLYKNDAKSNYWQVYEYAMQEDEEEVLDMLKFIREVDMVHIFANK